MGADHKRTVAVTSAALLAISLATPVAAQDAEMEADGHLARVLDRGQIVMSTDPLYPPQSFLDEEGNIVGFDIDVGTEIANRLGVDLVPTPVAWSVITAGSWADRFDMSVGSMTITTPREEVIDFTQPYYYTPAQIAAHADAGVSSIEDMAGMTFCVGEATTYLDWFNGQLDLGSMTPDVTPPEGATIVTRPTDRDCANEWGAGRRDFDGWITAAPTVQQAVDEGLPVVAIGDPIFYEPLAVAFDKTVEDNDSLVAAVDAAIGEMHADGTLAALSMEWYGEDLTTRADE